MSKLPKPAELAKVSVWGFRTLGRTRTLESHASRVRKKLCVSPDDRFIVNVWGVGYRLLE